MKIDDSVTFAPVVITIESEEELINLWHKLNSDLESGYLKRYPKAKGLSAVNSKMFDAIEKEIDRQGIKINRKSKG